MTIFEEKEGVFSMRRVSALLLFIACSIAGIVGLIFRADYKAVLAVCGTLGGCGVLLLLFTTWADIKSVVEVIKK